MSIPGGYILLARKITESGIMDKPPLYFKLWVWMLEQANHRDGYKGLKRGQLFTSIEEMREAMSWHIGYRTVRPSKKEIRSAYEWFSRKSNEGNTKGTMIGIAKGTHGMLITISNYDFYQNPKNYERHDEGHNGGNTKGTEGAQYKQEGKERKNDNTPTDDFLSFWEAYPKKVGKGAAWNAWKKTAKHRPPHDKVIEALNNHKQSEQWTKENGQYIPNPATWLNQHRWEDRLNDGQGPIPAKVTEVDQAYWDKLDEKLS